MNKIVVSTPRAPMPTAAFSQGIRVSEFVFVAGQTGVIPSTGAIPDSVEEQTQRAIANLAGVLEQAGTALQHVVKTTCFLARIEDFARFDAAYRDAMPAPLPARSTVGVSLAPGLLVEIEAIAAMPNSREA